MTAPLDPAVVAAIDDLELSAKLIVEGLRTGPHRSPFHGFSTEFSQHRPYRAGDDFRHLDWKLLARTNRLYSRQFRETTNLSVMVVLDPSASMAFPATGVSKFRYAAILAAALAYLVITDGDRAGLMTMTGPSLTFVPARGGRPHLRTLLAQLAQIEPAGTWNPAQAIARAADLLKRRGLVLVLSDFYDAEAETLRELKRVRRRGHDVAMLQVISPPELTFDYRGAREVEDLESGRRRVVDAAAIGDGYRTAIRSFLDRWRSEASREGITYGRFVTDEPPARTLRTFLLARDAHRHAGHRALRSAR